MGTAGQKRIAAKQGAEDAGKYFRYMSEFVGFTAEDADTIRQTKPIIEKHLPEYCFQVLHPSSPLSADAPVVSEERRHDRSRVYLELRMRHLTNFWLRTADAASSTTSTRATSITWGARTRRTAPIRTSILPSATSSGRWGLSSTPSAM